MKTKKGSSLSTRGLIIVSIPIICQIVLLLMLLSVHLHSEQFALQTSRSTEISASLAAALNDFLELDFQGQRYGIDYAMSDEFREDFDHLRDQFHTLSMLMSDDFKATQAIKNIQTDFKNIDSFLKTAPEAVSAGEASREDWIDKLGNLATIQLTDMDVLQKMLHEQQEHAARTGASLSEANADYERILWGGAILEVLLTFASFLLFRKNISRRLEAIKENSILLAAGKPLRRRIGGNDELSTLDESFRRMAIELNQLTQVETALLQNARDVVCSLNDKLAFIEMNKAASSVFDYSAEELIGMRLLNLSATADHNVILSEFDKARRGATCIFESRTVRKDGTLSDILWTVSWSNSKFICVAHDNYARKQAERARSGLVSMVRNELEMPLSTVAAVLDDVRHSRFGVLSERGAELSRVASAGMTQMLTLVNDLLDMEQMELGQLEIKPDAHRLAEIIEQAIYSVSGLSVTRKVTLRALPTNLEVYVDKNRITQVLVNLFTNAIKFSPQDSIVTVGSAAIAQFAEVSVQDTGRGIPSDVLPHIFERFKQTETADATKKGGSGLGLAICKALIELHGGTICVESREGQGSIFSFQIPLNTPQNTARSGAGYGA